jgi:hypothetical protein
MAAEFRRKSAESLVLFRPESAEAGADAIGYL